MAHLFCQRRQNFDSNRDISLQWGYSAKILPPRTPSSPSPAISLGDKPKCSGIGFLPGTQPWRGCAA